MLNRSRGQLRQRRSESLQEYRIPEFMGAVTQEIEGVIRRPDDIVGYEGPEKLEMARARLVHTR